MNRLLTVGHSVHDVDFFLDLLMSHGVTAVCDVRSFPQSNRNPQFNRGPLKAALRDREIEYVFLGNELGARASDPRCYVAGRAEYRLIAQTREFASGLERVRQGSKRYRIALMCAERDPITCHRTVLVCRHLRSPDLRIEHILSDGSLETQAEAEERMIALVGLEPTDLFEPVESLVERAYDLQGERIAYVKPAARLATTRSFVADTARREED